MTSNRALPLPENACSHAHPNTQAGGCCRCRGHGSIALRWIEMWGLGELAATQSRVTRPHRSSQLQALLAAFGSGKAHKQLVALAQRRLH